MTKLQIRETIETVLSNHKHSMKLKEDLLLAFESKVSGSEHPPVDGQSWCKFHKRYEDDENMVLSKGKSKGYCKAGISTWTKRMNESKVEDAKAIESLTKGEIKDAQESAKKAVDLKASARDYDTYDFDEDWANFKVKKSPKTPDVNDEDVVDMADEK